MKKENQIIIYTSPDNQTEVRVHLQDDTLWLTQAQMAELFDKSQATINEHIKNIYSTGELDEEKTLRKFGNSENSFTKPTNYYNLDMIISVGYRVNSKRGTAFRIWATQRLREYLVQGYSINEKRLEELGKTIKLLADTGKKIDESEAKSLLDIIASYTESFLLLGHFDSGNLIETGDPDITYVIDYYEAKNAIQELKTGLIEKDEATELFGNEKDESFIGILSNIVATFDQNYLYPTIEEQAAHLLYTIRDLKYGNAFQYHFAISGKNSGISNSGRFRSFEKMKRTFHFSHSTHLSKIIPLLMATSASEHFSSSGFSRKIVIDSRKTAK